MFQPRIIRLVIRPRIWQCWCKYHKKHATYDSQTFAPFRVEKCPLSNSLNLHAQLSSGAISQVAQNSGPPTARQRYAIKWRIAGGPLVARQCVLTGMPVFLCMSLFEFSAVDLLLRLSIS